MITQRLKNLLTFNQNPKFEKVLLHIASLPENEQNDAIDFLYFVGGVGDFDDRIS